MRSSRSLDFSTLLALIMMALLTCLFFVRPARPDRAATYVPGTSMFSPNVTHECPYAVSDGEPSVRVALTR